MIPLIVVPLPTCSLARKELLVPPPLLDDKRRALSKKGGEAPRLADIGVRPRPSSRFMLVSCKHASGCLAGW